SRPRHPRRRNPRARPRRRDRPARGRWGPRGDGPRPRHAGGEPGAATGARAEGAEAGGGALLGGRHRAADRLAVRGPVRILHVIQELGAGGAERILLSAYRGARAAGHEFFVAAAPGPLAAELEVDPLPLPLVRRQPWRIPSAVLAVRKAIRET